MLGYEKRSIINRHVLTATADITIAEALKLMNDNRSSCLFIVTIEALVGIFTEGDLVRLAANQMDLSSVKIEDVMSRELITITETEAQDVFLAIAKFREHEISHLPVIDEQGNLIGTITPNIEILQTLERLQDVVNEQASELKELNQQLQQELNHRRLFETKLRTSEAQIRAVIEAMTDIVLLVSINDNKVGTIQILPAYSGYEEQIKMNLASKTVEGFDLEHTAPIWLEKVQRAIQNQQIINFEYSLHLEDQERWYSVNISPIAEDKVLWVARDISKRKYMEVALQISETEERQKAQQLEVALVELKRAEAQLVFDEKMVSLGRMVGGIAHEINNPNSFIYGNIQPANEYAQELLHLVQLYQHYYPQPVLEISQKQSAIDLEYISQDFPKLLASIKQGAERISHIVRLLQSFSNIDSPKYKKIDIHQCIDSAIQFLQHRLQAQPNRQSIQVIKEYDAEKIIECYPSQISQVLTSIIANAIDAIDEVAESAIDVHQYQNRYIRICTEVINSRILIKIVNNGAILKPEIIPKIFDPFFTTKAPGKGIGLSLSICYKIIFESHKGQISCNSNGQDTEFLIYLPIVQRKA